MMQVSTIRSANPAAKAVSGRALILAGLLLLRRPWGRLGARALALRGTIDGTL